MALTGTGNTLGDAIVTALGIDVDVNLSSGEITTIRNKWRTIASTEIAHYIANTIVNTNVAVTNVSGVVSGPSSSGPGSGVGTGTIT